MHRWHAIALFCEDVREEKQGDTILGIYPDVVNASTIPGMFPKLGIYFRIHLSSSLPVKSVTGRLRCPDGNEYMIGEFDENNLKSIQAASVARGNPSSGLIMRAVAAPFPVNVAGRVEAVVTVDSDEEVCGSLNIIQSTRVAATASALPASQPPSDASPSS